MARARREDAAVIAPGRVLDRVTIDVLGLDALLHALADAGYQVIGPTVRDRAVVLDEIESTDDLPRGWGDVQDGGTYRLRRRDDDAFFGWAVGAHSWKPYLFPPQVTLFSATRDEAGFCVDEQRESVPPRAFFGVRSCDLHAIAIQDRVFLEGERPDPHYARRREGLLLIAVNCSDPVATCFCTSMGTGPRASGGYDLALTELLDDGEHRFVVEVGSERGADIVRTIPTSATPVAELDAVVQVTVRAAGRITRSVDTNGIRELLATSLEHPRWDDVAERCLACTNCTLVCPTCFCSTVEDHSDLTGQHAERSRRWDSCFTLDHSYLHGGSVRPTQKARYRQWLTHKMGTWIDQFDSSGCVGCGRCITWCPVGIDLTEELAAMRATPGGSAVPYPSRGRLA
jgi:ferredoxin